MRSRVDRWHAMFVRLPLLQNNYVIYRNRGIVAIWQRPLSIGGRVRSMYRALFSLNELDRTSENDKFDGECERAA